MHRANMFIPILFATLAAVIIRAENPECEAELNVVPDDCCRAMPLFVREEVLTECGLQDIDENIDGSLPCGPFECMLQKENVLTVDKKIDRTVIKSTISSKYGSEWHSAINIALEKCFEEIDNNNSDCEARQFSSCFLHYVILNCPENYWIDSNDCRVAKSFLQNCIPPAQ